MFEISTPLFALQLRYTHTKVSIFFASRSCDTSLKDTRYLHPFNLRSWPAPQRTPWWCKPLTRSTRCSRSSDIGIRRNLSSLKYGMTEGTPSPFQHVTARQGSPTLPRPLHLRLPAKVNIRAFDRLVDTLHFSLSEAFGYYSWAFNAICHSLRSGTSQCGQCTFTFFVTLIEHLCQANAKLTSINVRDFSYIFSLCVVAGVLLVSARLWFLKPSCFVYVLMLSFLCASTLFA